jgi:hypothetical protein
VWCASATNDKVVAVFGPPPCSSNMHSHYGSALTVLEALQLGSRLPTCCPSDHMIDQLASAESILSIHDRPHVERRRAT